MEQCPECRHWTVELSISEKKLKCYRTQCHYEEPVDVDSYLEQRSEKNVLPLLTKSLMINV
jgi:hypothetical protein